MVKKTAALLLFIGCSYAHAQTDSTLAHSTVKSISDERYNALIKGIDLDNMAAVAELNHYPMPDKVLRYKKQLDLRPTQLSKLTAINTELHRKRVEMGGNIITNEKKLDDLFRMHQVDDGVIIFYTNRYGLYQGEIRNAILQACYKTEELLSEGQLKQLEILENHK
ncbi:hypothetical protein HDF19_09300 [Mucilaginibacter sp. E4BP6]|uniref:hypothetical protein n=1 Tax=Mucilaginibacter sp. E4BP6 TaxID=2723089 RepID=UPI0015CB0443|nr:hypothetical protein [Mucilaginibacter sp. E4BP6]NYE67672.1 hypothetical protein [Mucilaginibacter sp. E4BP6]